MQSARPAGSMNGLPLLRNFASGALIGWRDGKPVTVERFLSAVWALARMLPPRRFCVNACDDRLNFMLAFAAALVARSTSLLPQSRASGHLRELAVGYEDLYCITDSQPVAGLERMTGVTSPPPKITYDLSALQSPGPVGEVINVQWAIPEPTAIAMLETQRFLFSPAQEYPGFTEAMWADALPKLVQARLIESFENYDIAHAPLRAADIGQTEFQLLLDLRRFRIAVEPGPAAEIGLSARIVDKNGNVVASRLFEQSESFASVVPAEAVAAFSTAFGRLAKDIIAWTAQSYPAK